MCSDIRDAIRPDEIHFLHNGHDVVIAKRRIHQWRTDLMIRVDGREAYLCRHEGGMTRREVKQLAREWFERNRGRR